MRLYIHQLNHVYSLLQTGKLEDAAKEFVQALQDIDFTNLQTGEPLTVDFYGLEVLFRIDGVLSKIDRNTFWKKVQSFPIKSVSSLLEDFQLFLDKCMKQLPSAGDPYRTSQLRLLADQHSTLPGLQYLLALALGIEGAEKADSSKIQQSLVVFSLLAPLAKDEWISNGADSQSLIFSQTRINALARYLRLLEPKEALDILNRELSAGWSAEAGHLHDHLITRRESLADAVNLKEKIEKNLEESSRQYQIKHVEMLVIFFGLIALVLGILHIVPSQKTVSDALALILGLSFGLIAAQAIILSLLASNNSQRCCRFIVGIISLLSLWSLSMSATDVKKQSVLTQDQLINEKKEIPEHPSEINEKG